MQPKPAPAFLLQDLGDGEYFRHNRRDGIKIKAENGKNVIWLKSGRPGFLDRQTVVSPMLAPDKSAQNVVEMFLCRGSMRAFT